MKVFQSRAFSYAKDPEHAEQNQDAFQLDADRGMAVIADGVSSAIFSAAWADLLTRKVLEEWPNPENGERFAQWLQARRREWFQGIDTTNLAWFQRPKLATGAFSTLLWVRLEPCAPPEEGEPEWDWVETLAPGRKCYRMTGYAIGDSCLFHLRPGKPATGSFDGTDLLKVIPVEKSEDFEESPVVLGSADLGKDAFLEFHPIQRIVQEGDWVILATDAVAQWALRCYEAGVNPNWEGFWELSMREFAQEMDQMRSVGEIRYDDATLALLRMGVEVNGAVSREVEQFQEISPAFSEEYPPEIPEMTQEEETWEEAVPKEREIRPEPVISPVFPSHTSAEMPKKSLTERLSGEPWEPWIEKSGEVGNRIAEKAQQWQEQGTAMAENVGEKISDGMNKLGEKTHEMLEAAKPKMRNAMKQFWGFFKKEEATEEEEPEEKPEPKVVRQIDPNRKRFYRPKD
ncbi:MAG: hypothetical protein Q4D62_06040 [Planctomycetia bacterium]|nr:hypothetical protein [Planctomycetia bacterium]